MLNLSSISSTRKLILLVCLLSLVLVLVLVLALIYTNQFFMKKPAPNTSGAGLSSKGEQSRQSSGARDNSTTSSITLLSPSGNFVSNHRPNLGGSPAPDTESSVCTTTPGATCKITFESDGVTKQLAEKTTDSNGSAYWNWKLSDIGLTVGIWKIKAWSSLGNQTRSESDAMNLVVAQ